MYREAIFSAIRIVDRVWQVFQKRRAKKLLGDDSHMGPLRSVRTMRRKSLPVLGGVMRRDIGIPCWKSPSPSGGRFSEGLPTVVLHIGGTLSNARSARPNGRMKPDNVRRTRQHWGGLMTCQSQIASDTAHARSQTKARPVLFGPGSGN
ncbi:hypothetical protein N7516_008252 [Penicillium verrucosum]|uniref:uncharacterized protein n=1 Tax=Penicillium verrucosum TaxID=60171 RepID=UPI002544EC68|nr:uncharacterized protein N7516_008252 [Penicillium verrucosum]KAJ5926479.1 hypothetical protein N7516_008252 [Penicillium verrucosum]